MRHVTQSLVAVAVLLGAGLATFEMVSAGSAKTTSTSLLGEQAGELRSTMTLREVEAVTGVPRDYLIRYLNLPGCVAGDKNKPAHEWLSKHGLTMTDLREAVDRYRTGHRF